MRTKNKTRETENPFFITSTIVNWIPVFSNEIYSNLLFRNFIFYQKKYEMEIIAYVIMPDHFHMICNSRSLRKAVQSLKSYSAKEIIKQLFSYNEIDFLIKFRMNKLKFKIDSEFQIWQEGYHPKEMFNNIILKQKIEYIHFNPVKKGLVSNPEDWKYSSAEFYLTGKQSDLIITPYY